MPNKSARTRRINLPRRVFLDTNVVNFVLDHGMCIFEGEEPQESLSASDLSDLQALHLIFLTGERAHWELAVSPLTYQEISQTPDLERRKDLERWLGELWCYWRDCFAEDGTLSDAYAKELEHRLVGSPLLRCFPDRSDRALISHAIAYQCDAFCTRDRKTILKRLKAAPELPLEVLSPTQWGERIWAVRHGF